MIGSATRRSVASLVLTVAGLLFLAIPAGADDGLDDLTRSPSFRQPHADILRLYYAFFDRDPDVGGARYWIGRYDDGATIAEIARHMSHSPEFADRYGTTEVEGYVTALYENVLDRNPDPQGFAFWTEGLNSGRITRLYTLRHFAASSEFVATHRFPGEENALPGPPLSRPVGIGGPIITFSVEIEPRLGWSWNDTATEIVAILGDPRSWIGSGDLRFRLADPEDADVRIRVATPATVDARCRPLRTGGRFSCRNGRSLNINSDRWARATSFWTASLGEYRAYVINHEMGHFLGRGHESCPGPGRLAPVMQQQTKSLAGCVENGWPYP